MTLMASQPILVHDGDCDDPKSWENLLNEIGRVEKFGVYQLRRHASPSGVSGSSSSSDGEDERGC